MTSDRAKIKIKIGRLRGIIFPAHGAGVIPPHKGAGFWDYRLVTKPNDTPYAPVAPLLPA